jgi:hypothetical protein
MRHPHITTIAVMQASSLDWFVAPPSASAQHTQYSAGRAIGSSDGSGGGGNTTRRSDAAGGDNAPSWLTMDGQVCRYYPRFFYSCFSVLMFDVLGSLAGL